MTATEVQTAKKYQKELKELKLTVGDTAKIVGINERLLQRYYAGKNVCNSTKQALNLCLETLIKKTKNGYKHEGSTKEATGSAIPKRSGAPINGTSVG